MIELQRFGDVTRVRLASLGSRMARLDVSAYLVRDVLVDTGFPHVRRALANLLDERRIEGAMITHWHEDHAGNAELLAARGIPLAMHDETERKLRASEPIRLYRRVVWGSSPTLRAPLRPFGHSVLRLVQTPGHSPDHQVVWDPESETVFSGDLWLGVRSRVMHESENPRLIVDSLRTVLALKPRRMFDAHRGEVREPVDAIAAKIGWMEDTLGTIESRLDAGWSDRAILDAVLGGDEPVALLSFGEYARMNFVKAARRWRVKAPPDRT